MNYVYCIIMGNSEEGPCKVGVSSDLAGRITSLQGGNPDELNYAWFVEVGGRRDAFDIEQRILTALRPSPYGGLSTRKKLMSEWLDATPWEVYAAGRDMMESVTRKGVA